jgi:hypothetical protein
MPRARKKKATKPKAAIMVYYTSIDGAEKADAFNTVEEAGAWARHWVGDHPEIGSSYAVSGDGIGKIEVMGAELADLFPSPVEQTAEEINAELAAVAELLDAVDSETVELEVTMVEDIEVPRLATGRTSREERVHMLDTLFKLFGTDRIPAAALSACGFPPSAVKHQPYWKSNGPGAIAADDLDFVASLHKRKDAGVYLSLTVK